jgi:transketolase
MRNRFGQWINTAAQQHSNLLLLSGDIGFGIFDDFIREHPNKFINCGIAEQNMIGVASGLAANGFIPVVYTITPFLICRPYEFIRNLIAYQNLPVILVGVGGGFSYDNLGHTHYGLEDINLIRGLPNFSVSLPFDPNSVELCLNRALNIPGPHYIRLMKGGEPELNLVNPSSSINSELCLKSHGHDFTILTHGGLVHEALEAIDLLNDIHGIMGSVVTILNENTANLHTLCHGDVFIYEENTFPGVYGKFLIDKEILENVKIFKYANNQNLNLLLNRPQILDSQGLSSKSMVADIMSLGGF